MLIYCFSCCIIIFMEEYKVVRSARKTLALHIEKDLTLTVKAPYSVPDSVIAAEVAKHAKWIENTRRRIQNAPDSPSDSLSAEQTEALKRRAAEYLPGRVEYWSRVTGLKYSYLKITSARRRFGSCNSKKGICLSYRLILYPDEAIDYVIVHELCHTVHMNHSAQFYALADSILPDRIRCEKLLRGEVL